MTMENVKYQDLYAFHFLSDVQFSPDGACAIFTETKADEEKNGYLSDLWLLDAVTGTCRQLTCGGEVKNPFWMDQRTVAFMADREKKAAFYQISIDGGEAVKFLEIEERVSSIRPLGAEKYLFLSPQKCEGEPEKKENCAQEGRDLYVFDEIPFWFNGKGVTNKVRSGLFVYDAKKQSREPGSESTPDTQAVYKRLTPKYMDVSAYQLSPDKTKVAFVGIEYEDVLPRTSGLYLYDLESDICKTLIQPDQMSVASPHFMGENRLFFTGTTFEFSGRNPRYYICDLKTGEIRDLPFCDASPKGSVGTDCNFGGGNGMKYVNEKLYFSQLSWGNARLVSMDEAGNLEKVCTAQGSFNSFDIYENQVLMTAMRGVDLVEVWSLDLVSGKEKQLTHFNTKYMETHSVIEPERFTFTNSAGVELEGFVLKPLSYVPGKKYPGILEMHGGPKTVYGSVFHHEMQCFANQGYFVFYTNPRGSDGRGEKFADITENLGYIDYEDFMEFTDEVLKRYPDIEEKKVGICGGSYGGFMCNWMIGHTDRFAAAASQRSISSYLTKSLCTDIGFSHNMAQLGTNPWEDFDTVWEHSPLKCAPFAKTPTLFIQSDEDYRCWMSDALQMFTALKMNGVDAKVALFHGENHELSRSGKPHNRISRLSEIGDWFARYLK